MIVGYELYRYDCFIVWGHGLNNLLDIVDVISRDFEILLIKRMKVNSMKRFIRSVYNFDYAPLQHLKSKNDFLNKVVNEVACVFVKNNKPEFEYFGDGLFRHLECINIKKVKDSIRKEFNPRDINGHASHDHVVHATDNEMQAMDIARIFNIDLKVLEERFAWLPYHLDCHESYKVEYVDIDLLLCNVVSLKDNRYYINPTFIDYSPQYMTLKYNDWSIYREYLQLFLGRPLLDYYSVGKFQRLNEEFYVTNYSPIPVCKKVVETYEKYQVLDGLHRVSILKKRGKMKIKVLICDV